MCTFRDRSKVALQRWRSSFALRLASCTLSVRSSKLAALPCNESLAHVSIRISTCIWSSQLGQTPQQQQSTAEASRKASRSVKRFCSCRCRQDVRLRVLSFARR